MNGKCVTLCDLFYFISTFRFICLFICLFFHIFFIHRILRWRSERKEKKLNRFDFIRFTSIALLKIKKKQPINLLLFNLIEFLSKRKKKRNWVGLVNAVLLLLADCTQHSCKMFHCRCQMQRKPNRSPANEELWQSIYLMLA